MIFTASSFGLNLLWDGGVCWTIYKAKQKYFQKVTSQGVTSVLTLARPPSAWPSTITYWLWCAKISGHEKFRIGLISGTVLMQDRLVMMYWITESRT